MPTAFRCSITAVTWASSTTRSRSPSGASATGTCWRRSDDPDRHARWILAADWLVENLSPTRTACPVWKHHFDWKYRDTLRAGWYSALSQGQGLSLLCRAHARHRRRALSRRRARGVRRDDGHHRRGRGADQGGLDGAWLEEAVVDPPTHILNGFLWAIWGVRDYAVASRDARSVGVASRLRSYAPPQPAGVRLRILVALRAVGNTPPNAGESVLPRAAREPAHHHGAAARPAGAGGVGGALARLREQRVVPAARRSSQKALFEALHTAQGHR